MYHMYIHVPVHDIEKHTSSYIHTYIHTYIQVHTYMNYVCSTQYIHVATHVHYVCTHVCDVHIHVLLHSHVLRITASSMQFFNGIGSTRTCIVGMYLVTDISVSFAHSSSTCMYVCMYFYFYGIHEKLCLRFHMNFKNKNIKQRFQKTNQILQGEPPLPICTVFVNTTYYGISLKSSPKCDFVPSGRYMCRLYLYRTVGTCILLVLYTRVHTRTRINNACTHVYTTVHPFRILLLPTNYIYIP